jgi:hypothetical protein
MRIGHHGYEIEVHGGRTDWLWVVFDEEGDQLRSGHAQTQASALRRARRTVAWLSNPLIAWIEPLLTPASPQA